MKQRLLSGLMLVAMAATAQRSAIAFEEYTLDNGLHVILHQDNSTPIVAVTISYHVGSKNEVPGRTGFAHFFEHLLFEGSENIARGEFDKHVALAGGALNANTGFDRTFYYEILPSNQLELGLWLESERLLHAKVEEVGVETQREVVKEEKRQRIDNQPYMSFQSKVFAGAYAGTPYSWVPIGSMEDLNAAQIDEFRAFYKQFYVPNNATLSIAGDIDIKQTKALIQKYFGDIPRGAEVVQPKFTAPPMEAEIRETVYDNIQLPAVIMAYRIPPQTSTEAYQVDMLSRLLAGGASSRMTRKLVDEDQLALQVGMFPFQSENGGLIIIFGLANAGVSPADLEAGIQAEIERMKTEAPTEREFTKLMNQVENDFISSNSTMAGIAESLSDYHMFYGNANLINTEIERYRSVKPEDLKAAAQKYLVNNNRVVLTYLPKADEPESPAQTNAQ
jgi:predicted Zn-dependent peptidase